ncbi:hypothetical protein B0O80DRAFT_433454 [Mortierella sp. GBAus27b]|nr:THUMP domain-containing protein 1 [Mortierella sp. GBA43]KAI8363312.1 hypothetical protein B0O80DRAFT_433454 [Mortierella sp. GBAus27b]
MGSSKRRAAKTQGGTEKKVKTDVHKIGKYLPGGFAIDPRMKGVMVTCARGRETQAGKEACDLLSEYADKLYGPISNDDPTETQDDESIEDAIAREVAQAKKPKGRKFLTLTTGTECVIFIRAMEIEPSVLCHYVLSDLQKSGSKRTRFCQRFIPVDETSYANMDDIEVMMDRVLKPYFHAEGQGPTTFKIIPKIRHNDKVDREVLLKTMATSVGRGEKHTVNLTNPEYVILAEVIKSICFLSVVKDYESLKKYNVQSIFEASKQSATDGTEEESGDKTKGIQNDHGETKDLKVDVANDPEA